MQVGDIFIINNKGSRGSRYYFYKCKDPDKRFEIKSFTKSGLSVYYDDKRTNIKCKCNNCKPVKEERCIGISEITIVESRLERLRELKLKMILGK